MRIGDLNLGSTSDDGPVEVREVTASNLHPDYVSGQAYFDAAVLSFDEPVNYSPEIQPLCLPDEATDEQDKFVDRAVSLAGWGTNGRNSTTQTNVLQSIMISQVPQG